MKNKELILSTGNIHKVEEIKDILMGLPITVLSKDDLEIENFEVYEDGQTLEENAIKKAKELASRVKGMVMADDSGLFVEHLDYGRSPGIHSARYAGVGATDKANNEKLLKGLEGVPLEERKAKFKTVIALVLEDGDIITVTGECMGIIGFEPRGDKGFGYDPLFIVEEYGKTFAELGEEIKNKISHRARALNKLKGEIVKMVKDE